MDGDESSALLASFDLSISSYKMNKNQKSKNKTKETNRQNDAGITTRMEDRERRRRKEFMIRRRTLRRVAG